MPVSEKQKNHAKKYIQGLDEFKVRLPKGYKEIIKRHAEECGESMNAFFKRAVDEAINNDNWQK